MLCSEGVGKITYFFFYLSLLGLCACSSTKTTPCLVEEQLSDVENNQSDNSKTPENEYSTDRDFQASQRLSQTDGAHENNNQTINLELPRAENDTTFADKDEIDVCPKRQEKKPFGIASIDIARRSVGSRYLKFSQSMDRIFSGNRSTILEENESFLRLETQSTFYERGDFEQDISLRAKLDLPKTQDKFELYFDSAFADGKSLAERNAVVSSGENINDRSSAAGFEYSKKKTDSPWFTGFRLGAETQVPLRTFARVKAGRRWKLNEAFSTRFQQDFWHLDGVGWGETTYLDLKAKINDMSYVLLQNEVEYEDEPFPISHYHALNLFHRINDRFRMRYRIAALGSNDDDNTIDKYFINITHTYRLYEDWLFVSLIPELLFRAQYQTDKEFAERPRQVPEDWEPWEPEFALTIKFDIFSH